MKPVSFSRKNVFALLIAGCLNSVVSLAQAPVPVPTSDSGLSAAPAVRKTLPSSPPFGVTDLKFGDFFKMPVGPRGLEPSEKLLALNGKPVRLVGYMVHSETPERGMFILSPLPVSEGDEDESLADDLPPNVAFVHLSDPKRSIPYVPGLLRLTGVLQVGAESEADGRVSAVRLLADTATTKALLEIHPDPSSKH